MSHIIAHFTIQLRGTSIALSIEAGISRYVAYIIIRGHHYRDTILIIDVQLPLLYCAFMARVMIPDRAHHVKQRGNRRLPVFFPTTTGRLI